MDNGSIVGYSNPCTTVSGKSITTNTINNTFIPLNFWFRELYDFSRLFGIEESNAPPDRCRIDINIYAPLNSNVIKFIGTTTNLYKQGNSE